MVTYAPPPTLMQFWRLHKHECRGIGGIVADARIGRLPGVESSPSGFGFSVVNRRVALAAMQKGSDHAA